jgi:hypothetical protein
MDARLLKEGWLALMQTEEIAVYLFLCLVANQQGVAGTGGIAFARRSI